MSSSSERTEKPTAKKRRDSLKKGQMARSKEIPGVLVYLSGLLYFAVYGPQFLEQLKNLFRFFWRTFLLVEIDAETGPQLIYIVLTSVFQVAGPIIALVLCVGVTSNLMQGVAISTYRLQPKLDSLNPTTNVKKLFSMRGLVELAKAAGIVLFIGYVAWDVLGGGFTWFQKMIFLDIGSLLAEFSTLLYTITIRVALFMIVVAAGDYIFQKYTHEKSLKQTKQEVKDDTKATEGSPLIKSRIRSVQREMSRRRMMADVKDADVVVTNPNEYAVALKYDVNNMAAPRVIAKGRGHVALRIKEVARQFNVITVENIALAQALYRAVEIGAEIPDSLYKAVAQILAYVYKLRETHWH